MSFPTIPTMISSDQYRAADQLKPLFQHLIDNGWTANQIDAAINDKKFWLRMKSADASIVHEVNVSPRSIYVAFDWVKSILADMPQTTETPSFDDDAEVIDIATRKPATRTSTATAPLATSKQVALIMKLIGQGKHREGGYVSGPTTAEGARTMTRQGASQYIDSLLGNY